MSETALVDVEAQTLHRLGLDWCPEHQQALIFCRDATHNWGTHNALRRYTGLMVKGKTHPFVQAGGPLVGVREGDDALTAALARATKERVALDRVIATQPVTPQHLGLMLRGKAPAPRLGNSPYEQSETPTLIQCGSRFAIADGHHRFTRAWAKGDTHLLSRVVRGVTPVFQNTDSLLVAPD